MASASRRRFARGGPLSTHGVTVVQTLLVGSLLVLVALVLVACTVTTEEDDAAAAEQALTVEPVVESTATSIPEQDETPTATPEPTSQPTPEPSPTTEPTVTPESTPAPEPTPTPESEAMCPERGDDQWVYATDSAGHKVHVFDLEGTAVCSWGEYGTWPGGFNEPFGITTDNHGNVYVADSANSRVQIFSDRGAYLDEWSFEDEPGFITHVAASPSGTYLYVVDRGRGRLRVIDLDSMETIGELDHEVVQSSRGLTSWEGDTVALALPGGLFIVEPSADNQILFSPAEGVLPSGAIQVGGGHSLIVLDVAAQPVTAIAVMNEIGETTDFLVDDVGSDVLFSYNDQIGLALGRDGQLVISERSANTIGILSIDALPTASVVTLWQLESDEPDVEIDLQLIALSP